MSCSWLSYVPSYFLLYYNEGFSFSKWHFWSHTPNQYVLHSLPILYLVKRSCSIWQQTAFAQQWLFSSSVACSSCSLFSWTALLCIPLSLAVVLMRVHGSTWYLQLCPFFQKKSLLSEGVWLSSSEWVRRIKADIPLTKSPTSLRQTGRPVFQCSVITVMSGKLAAYLHLQVVPLRDGVDLKGKRVDLQLEPCK